MEYTRALERLRSLRLVSNALDLAMSLAVADLVSAAKLAPTDGPAYDPHLRHGSGVRARDPNLDRRIGAVEVERYVHDAWLAARGDEDHARLRALIATTLESGLLEADGAQRLIQLIAA